MGITFHLSRWGCVWWVTSINLSGFAGYAVFRVDGGGFGRRVMLGPRNYGVMDNYPGDPLPVVGTRFRSDTWVCLGVENGEGENFCI